MQAQRDRCNCDNCSTSCRAKQMPKIAANECSSEQEDPVLETVEFLDEKKHKKQKEKTAFVKKCVTVQPKINLTASPKNSLILRSKRCIFKVRSKNSITCQDFIEKFNEIQKTRSNVNAYQISQKIINLIQFSFSLDLYILGNSFLFIKNFLKNDKFCQTKKQRNVKSGNQNNSLRLDIDGLEKIFNIIKSLDFEDTMAQLTERFQQIITAVIRTKYNHMKKNSYKTLRAIILIFLSPSFATICEKEDCSDMVDKFIFEVSNLLTTSKEKLIDAIKGFRKDSFIRVVSALQQNISKKCLNSEMNQFLDSMLEVLGLFYKADGKNYAYYFHNDSVKEYMFYQFDSGNIHTKQDFLIKNPWIINLETKKCLLTKENISRQFHFSFISRTLQSQNFCPGSPHRQNRINAPSQNVSRRSQNGQRVPLRSLDSEQNSLSNLPSNSVSNIEENSPQNLIQERNSPQNLMQNFQLDEIMARRDEFNEMAFIEFFRRSEYCYFVICRDHILEDTFRFLEIYSISELAKPLKVIFCKEPGVDEGGVKKEYFQLLSNNIYNQNFGMFESSSESNLTYFKRSAVPISKLDFEYCGTLFALALYNDVMLNINFPNAFYKILMSKEVTFEDLKELSPELGNGLQKMLDFEGDVENIFCRNFEAEYEYFGTNIVSELVENGSKKAVTNKNRKKFVELYTKWYLIDSVIDQIKGFKKGFFNIFPELSQWILKIFNAEELKLVLCGEQNLDFEAWKSNTTLTGYTWNDPTIRKFWKIIESFDFNMKQRLIFFVTGCVRAPINGLANLPLRIIRGDNPNLLPTSSTCFNQLVLPPYRTRSRLKKFLLLALENAEGFGLQ